MNKWFRKLVLSPVIATLLVVCNNARASQNSSVDLQNILDSAIKSQDAKDAHITGIPLTFQCSGFNNNQPMSLATGKISNQPAAKDLPTDAIFQVGSITKTFIAVVALKLETAGYFGAKGLNSTVGEILGNQPSSASWKSNWNRITLRQLLNMTSGIPDDLDDDSSHAIMKLYSTNPFYQFTTTDLLNAAVNIKPPYPSKSSYKPYAPGFGWNYSNTNYVIMGKIISYVTGKSIQDELANEITRPLNLDHTYYVENIPEDAITRGEQKQLLMSGYWYGPKMGYLYPGADIKSYTLSFANAEGAIISNTADLNTFMQALFAPDGKFLTQSELNELTKFVAVMDEGKYKAGDHLVDGITSDTPHGFGLGINGDIWKIPDGSLVTAYSKPGGNPGYNSIIIYVKNQHAFISYLVNSSAESVFSVQMNIFNQAVMKAIKDCNITK